MLRRQVRRRLRDVKRCCHTSIPSKRKLLINAVLLHYAPLRSITHLLSDTSLLCSYFSLSYSSLARVESSIRKSLGIVSKRGGGVLGLIPAKPPTSCIVTLECPTARGWPRGLWTSPTRFTSAPFYPWSTFFYF